LGEKLAQYAEELRWANDLLARQGKLCVVRRRHLDEDLRHSEEEAGGAEGEILLVEDDQDILEVFAHATAEERAALLNDCLGALVRVEAPA
jgi:hypothetical protein